MRSALLCVFLTLIANRRGSGAEGDDFRPTPIPLNDWHYDKRDSRAGTLHETIKTESPTTVAVVPAHYWEDALRHSVYLTLVRDKIDQLIAKGDVISPNSKPTESISKEVDDRDLWEKIKSAPFDRLDEEEPSSLGDVTIVAKGRLLEDKGGFRFTEDDRLKEKCGAKNCTEGVKAFWSVKRVRQRDQEISPGRYHYELTFSVISQPPKKERKPYENPIRTFTVRESSPDRTVGIPQEYRKFDPQRTQPLRPERAVWFHKNIVPTQHQTARPYYSGLDRIFSSLFSDDEDETSPGPPRYKTNQYMPQLHPHYSKVGYVGAPTEHSQMKLASFGYKPHSFKYSRPPLQPPPLAHQYQMGPYIDLDTIGVLNSNEFSSQTDQRFGIPNKNIKTTRPPILPTPLPPLTPPLDLSADVTNVVNLESAENITKIPEMMTSYKSQNKVKPTPAKVSYFSDNIRPPVYNAPPGVFVTMDKKPFKPMPPLKLHSKPLRSNKPVDFRPSPQVLDVQFSEPDPLSDSAFRPITIHYDDTNSTEKNELASNLKKGDKRKVATGKKPPKKHEIVKAYHHSTIAPEIITVQSAPEDDSDLDWTNILGAFTKTTPMASQTEKTSGIGTTTATPTSTETKRITTTTEIPEEYTTHTTPPTTTTTTTTTTTAAPKPKKRTRPPPKFVKEDKIKKHKRITTTTTTTTSTTTKEPEKIIVRRPTHVDLTPQASSAATGTKSFRENKNNTTTTSTTTSTTTTSTTTPRPTTTRTQTTTTQPTTTETVKTTTELRNKNRFRQSTLMQKGTSVKHDRWSAPPALQKNQSSTSNTFSYRRKGSNFQGYVSSSTPRNLDKEREYHIDQVSSTISTTVSTVPITESSPEPTPTEDDLINPEDFDTEHESDNEFDDSEENRNSDVIEDEDHSEFIFEQPTTAPSERSNEIIEPEEPLPTDQIVSASTYNASPKNKTKCKKKKMQNLANMDSVDLTVLEIKPAATTTTSTTTTTETPDILQELLSAFNFGDDDKRVKTTTPKSELEEEESENHERYIKMDQEIEDLLDSLDNKKRPESYTDEDQYEDDDEKEPSIDEEDSQFAEIDSDREYDGEDDDDTEAISESREHNEKYKERPFSFLELMAME